MKLWMAIITELRSGIFGISLTQVSQIINTWVKMLAAILRTLIFCPSKRVIRQHLPKALEDYQRLRRTIGCTEIVIEHPRDLELQAITWSDYKKYNTIEFRVGIIPNGAIKVFFLSEAWDWRASDQKITRKSGFLYLVEANDLIMADRGFAIQEVLQPKPEFVWYWSS